VGTNASGGTYGAPTTFVALIPLFGGSGGGGGTFFAAGAGAGGSGGGGGGAIVIASSSRISVTGSIVANGGDTVGVCIGQTLGSGGSGGAIRLVAPQLTGTGALQVNGGSGNCSGTSPGRLRLEAFTQGFAGTFSTAPTFSTPGPVTASSNPSLANLPTLAIASVGGSAAPALPGGSYSTADVSLAQGVANPVTVTVAATNTPVGTPAAITVKLIPQNAAPTTIAVPPVNHTGTFLNSTATVGVNFPIGQVSVIQAFASMTLTGQIASLFPFIDGEPVERVALAALDGRTSTLSLITKSGKEKRIDELDAADQQKVALAWQVMRETRPQ
jgi:hypothetical protein